MPNTLSNLREKHVPVKIRILLVLILLLAISGLVYWLFLAKNSTENGNHVVLYGNVDIREVRLAFNNSEHVDKIMVHEGDKVAAGQLLAALHTDRLKAAWERARADVAAAKAEAYAAKVSYQRLQTLFKRKLASAEDTDLARAKSQAAAARVDAADAVLAQAAQALKDAKLFAPVDGVIRERIVEPGDFVTPQTPVLTLSRISPVWVRTYLPEPYLGKVKPGALAQIKTDSFPKKIYQGWVGSISPTAEFTPKSVETPELRTRLVYQVRVFVCNENSELRLGMPATVTLQLNQTTNSKNQSKPRCKPSGSTQK